MYFVYVIKSLKDGKFYFGQTQDLTKRLNRHNYGQVISTKNRRPFVLIGHKDFKTRNEARWFEYLLKKHGDRKKKLLKELEAVGRVKKGLRPVGLKPNGLRPGGEVNN